MKRKGRPRCRAQTVVMHLVYDFINFRNMHGAVNPVVISFMQKHYDEKTYWQIPETKFRWIEINCRQVIQPKPIGYGTEKSENGRRNNAPVNFLLNLILFERPLT